MHSSIFGYFACLVKKLRILGQRNNRLIGTGGKEPAKATAFPPILFRTFGQSQPVIYCVARDLSAPHKDAEIISFSENPTPNNKP